MRFLACTWIPLERPSAGLNLFLRMRRSLENQGIDMILVGQQDDMDAPWRETSLQGRPAIAFSGQHTGVRRYSLALTHAAQAAKFYRDTLPTLLTEYECDGAIVYSFQAQTAQAVLEGCRSLNKLVIADMVEWYRWSAYCLLNGVNIQQHRLCRSVLPNMDGIIGISKAWCAWAEARGVPSVWIPAFAEDRGCSRITPSPPDQPFTITFIGHWVDRELPNVILRALRLCIDRGLDIRMNVLGNAGQTRNERKAMRLLRADNVLQGHVNFLGFVSDEERDRQLAQADAFVLLRSDCRETDMLFPTRLPEYLLSGNPVILSKVGSFQSCFEHGKDVWFLSRKNRPEELAEALIWLAGHPKERMEIGRCGRQSAIAQFSLDVLGRRLADFLENLAKPHNRRS